MPTPTLNLPTTHEATRQALSHEGAQYHAQMAQFVQPVEATERQVAEILTRLPPISGRAALLLGDTGSGKSTFVESIAWRKHLGLARLWSIDCSELPATNILDELTAILQTMCRNARGKQGRTAIAIDYLESLGDLDTQAFFQAVNGQLRKSPVFIVWPVTKRDEALAMLEKARAVSGTIFDKALPILNFKGPDYEHFAGIAANAITVFNNGRLLQEFLLTPADLEYICDDVFTDPELPSTIREYLERVYQHWSSSTGHLDQLLAKMPRPNEVWIVFCHPKAEGLVGQFANKGEHADSAWKAYHSKLWEYIPGTQREARWGSPTRLQYAIEGAFASRILHMSPQSVISATRAYGNDVLKSLELGAPKSWNRKESAKRHLSTTALLKQLVGAPPGRGKTPGGPAAEARKNAEQPFAKLNQFLAGSGRDRHVNKAIAGVLFDVLPDGYSVYPETAHPWLPSIVPDIRVDTPDGRQINLEFFYTNQQDDVWRVPDYSLDKLANYMDAIDIFVKG